ncbi:MAG: helix-turn-helix transcriptional regulator [Oligoflexales bacterium]
MRNKKAVSRNEQFVLSGLLLVALILIMFDIIGDFMAGTSVSHIVVESLIAIAIIGAFSMTLKDVLTVYQEEIRIAKEDAKIQKGVAEKYKQQTSNYLGGLGNEIERHMGDWKLTEAEKEVALLLIKGLPTRQIGEIRGVKEKTVRQQSLAVYKKSGLGNRSELAAFFLEDLLVPRTKTKIGIA